MAKKRGNWNPRNNRPPQGGNNEDPMLGPFNNKQFKFSIGYILIALATIYLVNLFMFTPNDAIPYSEFKSKISSGEIKRVDMDPNYYYGSTQVERRKDTSLVQALREPEGKSYKTVALPDADFIPLLDSKGVIYSAISQEGNMLINFLFQWILPLVLMIVIWRFFMRRMGNMGGNVLSFGQNKAVIVAEGDTNTKFSDVAGADEAKEELVEVIDFLKTPKKYTEIGGKIPKGVLLVGPPGTGKTLLARAVAGEAQVPFFRMSGAEFVEMFVGVGASRVRDLFAKAREKAPCIVFIDELDAIGKSRLNGLSGNDEREQTLNQLLVEMDGFDSTTGLILVAATNRPDVLDPALLRPGRFDRQVLVDRPDLKGREEILKIHARNVKLEAEVDLALVARQTSGFVGADLANIVNESALLAVRAGRKKVQQKDFFDAIEKVSVGLEKKSKVIKPRERRLIAYHETGHALVAGFTEGAKSVTKISIVPRGYGTLGYTLHLSEEDRYIATKQDLNAEIDSLLGGRAAEEIVLGEISTGAANDITRATDIARRMITDFGMSSRFANVALTKSGNNLMLGQIPESYLSKDYSDSTQQYVDEEVARTIAERYKAVKQLLSGKRELLDLVAKTLLEKETIEETEFRALIGLPPHKPDFPETPEKEGIPVLPTPKRKSVKAALSAIGKAAPAKRTAKKGK
jgi:cell division protease FtsH